MRPTTLWSSLFLFLGSCLLWANSSPAQSTSPPTTKATKRNTTSRPATSRPTTSTTRSATLPTTKRSAPTEKKNTSSFQLKQQGTAPHIRLQIRPKVGQTCEVTVQTQLHALNGKDIPIGSLSPPKTNPPGVPYMTLRYIYTQTVEKVAPSGATLTHKLKEYRPLSIMGKPPQKRMLLFFNLFRGLRWNYKVSPNGIVNDLSFAASPPQIRRFAKKFEQDLRAMLNLRYHRLPKVPIGVGARWNERREKPTPKKVQPPRPKTMQNTTEFQTQVTSIRPLRLRTLYRHSLAQQGVIGKRVTDVVYSGTGEYSTTSIAHRSHWKGYLRIALSGMNQPKQPTHRQAFHIRFSIESRQCN